MPSGGQNDKRGARSCPVLHGTLFSARCTAVNAHQRETQHTCKIPMNSTAPTGLLPLTHTRTNKDARA